MSIVGLCWTQLRQARWYGRHLSYEEHFGSTLKAMIDGFVIRLLGMHVRVIELLVIP